MSLVSFQLPQHMRLIQIKLLLWKNAILIKRKPVSLGFILILITTLCIKFYSGLFDCFSKTLTPQWITILQIVLPLVLFLILLMVRLKLPPVNVSDSE